MYNMNKTTLVAWIVTLTGTALWLYGYFATGNPPLIDWHANTPGWIADFLPNIESEIGMALACAGTIPLCLPQ